VFSESSRHQVFTFVFFIALRRRQLGTTLLPSNRIEAIFILSPSSIAKTTFFSVFETSSMRKSTVTLR
jgi:hypothetical protein